MRDFREMDPRGKKTKMIRRWEVFYSTPHEKYTPIPRASLSRHGVLSLNRAALELLDEPEAVELLFDRMTNCIGLRAASPKLGHAYRFSAKDRGRGRILYTKRFCNHYRIRLENTITFNRPEKSPEGILLLDLTNVTGFVRQGRARTQPD